MDHDFIAGDIWPEEDSNYTLDRCIICGGMWLTDIDGSGTLSMKGDLAADCTGNTSQCHHYAGECPNFDSACTIDSACNCLYCYS